MSLLRRDLIILPFGQQISARLQSGDALIDTHAFPADGAGDHALFTHAYYTSTQLNVPTLFPVIHSSGSVIIKYFRSYSIFLSPFFTTSVNETHRRHSCSLDSLILESGTHEMALKDD